jgi:hypothetical protein
MARGKAQAAITLAKGFLHCQAGFESYAVLFSESSLEVPYTTGWNDLNRPSTDLPPSLIKPSSAAKQARNLQKRFPRGAQSGFLQKMKATVLFRNLHIDFHWNLSPFKKGYLLASAPRVLRFLCNTSLLLAIAQTPRLNGQANLIIDHRYTNTDAQSLIGLPMGSHKTIVDKSGNLKWSQWSLKRKPLDTPIGFSSQMDGALAIEPSVASDGVSTPLAVQGQVLYQGRYPFVVSRLAAGGVSLEELTFAADPDQDPAKTPTATSGARGLDLVRLTFTNTNAAPVEVFVKLSGRERNLPGHANENSLISNAGEDVVLVDPAAGFTSSAADSGRTLAYRATVAPHKTRTLWLRLPYEWSAMRNANVSTLSGETLLQKAIAQWDALWSRGTRIRYPNAQLNDFFDSSIAYVLILTEYDAQGDLWALDGPAVYRQFWGRGEYFQARAMEVAGQLPPARESVEHSFHIQNDDGEWDGPPTSGYPAWDNTGGEAAAVWDYYLFSRDKAWLARAYPYLLRSSQWVNAHREETTVEDVPTTPTGAQPIRRMLASKCRPEPIPALAPGEKTYWYGLLPYSYGDSGLPEGHSYSHNFLAAYGVRVSAEAARTLGKTEDAAWLDHAYSDYVAAIRASVDRSVKLETISPAYLPAQPTRPDAAYSQTFLAIWPTGIYNPEDPLVTGLLTRMENEESQGEPTNVAWAGPAGIWPGESMNMSETYLLRGEVQKNADMLLAALNHSYTTNVWKEEILTDVTKERACDTPHSKRENMQGTGDQPEAWANANLVDLLRDMLVQERTDPATGKMTLHLLAGLPSAWLPPGQEVSIQNAPITLGTIVTLTVRATSAGTMQLTFTPGNQAIKTAVLHLPLAPRETVQKISIPTRQSGALTSEEKAESSADRIVLHNISSPITIDLELSK